MDDYISKPIDPQELRSLLAIHNDGKGGKTTDKNGQERGPNSLVGEHQESPQLDLAKALARVGGDKEFLQEMLQSFIASLPDQIDTFAATLEQGDGEYLMKQAHLLKGAAATLGVQRIASEAFRLEQMERDGDLSGGENSIGELKHELICLKAFLDEADWSTKKNSTGVHGQNVAEVLPLTMESHLNGIHEN